MNSTVKYVGIAILLGIALPIAKFFYDLRMQENSQIEAAPQVTVAKTFSLVPQEKVRVAFSSEGEDKRSPETLPVEAPPPRSIEGVSIAFPNGETVDVTLTSEFPQGSERYRVGEPLLEKYSELLALAKAGDPNIPRLVAQQLRNCELMRKNGMTLQEELADAKENTHPSELARHEEAIREMHAACEGISSEHVSEREMWLEIGMENGDFLATREYYYSLRKSGDSEAALPVLERMWADGNQGALLTYSFYYRDQGDQSRAYAYYLAYYETARAAWDRSVDSVQHQPRDVAVANNLAQKGAQLSYDELKDAEALAASVVRENGNCCKGFWSLGES